MKLAIMQPYFFPYLGYFQLIKSVDKFIIFDDVNYINKGWINRNRILVNGKEFVFTIPLEKASQNKLINEIEIVNEERWKTKLIKTLEKNYKHAPFYSDTISIIKEIILNSEKKLSKYILNSIKGLVDYFELNTKIIDSSSVYKTEQLKGSQKIFEICRQEKAEAYINPIGASKLGLYNKVSFEQHNIKLFYLKTENIVYSQFQNEFVPWLSIIDVLMFNGRQATGDKLNKFELV